jgi:hypothetical protein
MRTIPISVAPSASEPELFEMPWRDLTRMPFTAATLAQMWAVQVSVHLVLGQKEAEWFAIFPARPTAPATARLKWENSFRTRP